jgi:hypothetical protein
MRPDGCSGARRPARHGRSITGFDHWLQEEQESDSISADDAEQSNRLLELDTFENVWFPRMRAIIRRVVPKPQRETFTAAFFKDLAQQPLGPAVVGSVAKFIARVQDLAASSDPAAKEVHTTLRQRGLTDAKLESIKVLLQAAKGGATPGNKPAVAVTEEDLEQARMAQLQALESLRDWFNDWATTLRSRFGVRDQLRLGLTVRRGRGGGEDPPGGLPTDGGSPPPAA